MSVLSNFRKPGGLEQLLTILEVAEDTKRDQLLTMIELEDSGWAHIIRNKMLTVERILTWPKVEVAKVLSESSLSDLAPLFSILSPAAKSKILDCLDAASAGTLEEEAKKNFSKEVVFASKVKMIGFTRKLIQSNQIDLHQVDPEMQLNAA